MQVLLISAHKVFVMKAKDECIKEYNAGDKGTEQIN
jgi:hypothetical protein